MGELYHALFKIKQMLSFYKVSLLILPVMIFESPIEHNYISLLLHVRFTIILNTH